MVSEDGSKEPIRQPHRRTVAPNPYKPNDGRNATGQKFGSDRGIHFLKVPEGTTIKIYTALTGELVAEKNILTTGNYDWNWDATNGADDPVASRYYLYRVEHDGNTKTEKFSSIR